MTKEEILEKVKKMDVLGGMTFNERLFVTGLMETFEKVKRNVKELARFISEIIRIDKQSID
ncbi:MULTISPECIES: hypothetical protein [unclassified Flavobacterium]|uniref:hypothetical protein n=1 Tax=unclassified Flavobacterium TaxID=196869 RepID=UPI003F8EAC07